MRAPPQENPFRAASSVFTYHYTLGGILPYSIQLTFTASQLHCIDNSLAQTLVHHWSPAPDRVLRMLPGYEPSVIHRQADEAGRWVGTICFCLQALLKLQSSLLILLVWEETMWFDCCCLIHNINLVRSATFYCHLHCRKLEQCRQQ
ncbi:hypothetical protein L228DRAFT_178990 [Xylona heveae TC161]|uniref:Uncharacterized protein n=1 Tax=Xylona heveae (strain CBS 132557 / TC161) TaxID=1328760 RepID=A0A165FAP3_XYLHT|nr:hypothetical protein L228DRAFT_178990 [Xylona heveae TC161]KZF20768.1 hypothetical protein L228DRAFT_178990 [Xylona heveae TC161]